MPKKITCDICEESFDITTQCMCKACGNSWCMECMKELNSAKIPCAFCREPITMDSILLFNTVRHVIKKPNTEPKIPINIVTVPVPLPVPNPNIINNDNKYIEFVLYLEKKYKANTICTYLMSVDKMLNTRPVGNPIPIIEYIKNFDLTPYNKNYKYGRNAYLKFLSTVQ